MVAANSPKLSLASHSSAGHDAAILLVKSKWIHTCEGLGTEQVIVLASVTLTATLSILLYIVIVQQVKLFFQESQPAVIDVRVVWHAWY